MGHKMKIHHLMLSKTKDISLQLKRATAAKMSQSDRSRRRPPPPPPLDGEGSQLHVVALYDFTATEDSDLTLQQGEEYKILHKQDQLWWKAEDKQGYVRTGGAGERAILGGITSH